MFRDKLETSFQTLAFNRYPSGWKFYVGTVLMYYYMVLLYIRGWYRKIKK